MAGYLDGHWRIGSKARGTRSPVKHASEGLLPFKCTYPVQLTDVMDQVPSVQSDFLRGAISPTRETRTLAVREFEETIAELRKENFDLKLQLYLKDKSSSKNLKRDGDEEDKAVTVQIVVELQSENDSLKKELRSKDKLLQEALTQSENHASHVKELQKTLVEVQEKLLSIQTIPLEWKQDKENYKKENEYLNNILSEKDTVIQTANAQIDELSSQIEVLEAKLAKRRIALQGIVYKYHTDVEKIPKELRPIVQTAVQAAKECKEEELNSAILELKSSLCKLMPSSSEDILYSHNQQGENETKVSKHQSSTKENLISQSLESIVESEKSYGSEGSGHFDEMATVMKDSEKLKSENEEQARTIQSLNDECSELERRNIQLSSDLSEAISKVKSLETKVNEEMDKDDDLERKYLEDCLAQSNQVNQEILSHLRELEAFMEDLLQHRNLDSSSIANTSDILTRLTSFLDDTRKLSVALSEQISIHENSKHPDDISMRRSDYSQTEEQSHTEDQTNRSDTNTYSIAQGRQPFSQSEPHTNTAGTGKRRLSFTTLHNAGRMDPENVVVLGTSNNEDLILLLNEKGDPEDVLIRNNQTEPRNLTDFYGQLPRHCLDSSLGLWNQSWQPSPEKNYLHQEKTSMKRWGSSQIPIVGPNRCPSSDSDIWSEPDRDVSLQRIGIDVQKSPVTQKSPRRLRHRTTNESSSQKNESSSSAVKCHPLSKRRRSGDALKSPLVCKKCLSQSPSKSEAEKERLQKVVNDLHNKCNTQENKLEELNGNVKNKIDEIDALSKENNELLSYINDLETELNKLKAKEKEISLGTSESSCKFTEVNNENVKLKSYIKFLESKATESDSILETLKNDLMVSKTSLQNLEEICSDYKMELSTSVKALEDYKQKCDDLEEKFIQKTNDIEALTKENGELLSCIHELERETKELKSKENELTILSSESSEKLTKVSNENVELKNVLKSWKIQKTESDSFLEKLKQELQETRKCLQNLEDICSNYKMELSTSSKSLEDNIQKYNKLKERFMEKTRDIDALSKENNELLNSVNKLESIVKEMKTNEEELSLQSSESSAKITEVSNENVKLKNFIKSLETKAFESDSVCKKLKQELEETRRRLQNLDEKCSNYETKLSNSEQFSENMKEKYDNLEKEKNKLLIENSDLVKVKNELIRCIQNEKGKVQEILKENSNLKEELEEISKSLSALQSQYSKLQTVSAKILEEKENHLITSNSTSFELQEQYKKSKAQIKNLQQDLKSTKEELEATKFCMEDMKASVESLKQSLEDTELSLKQSKGMLSSSETKLSLVQKQLESQNALLDEKNRQISELQNKVLKSGTQLTGALLENRKLARQVKKNIPEQFNEMVSEFYPSKGSPNVSSSFETSISQESISASITSGSPTKDSESSNKIVTLKHAELKSLKTKLALAEQRITILEKEKACLREHLLAQVCKDKTASQSLKDLDNLRKDNADLQDQLQAKSSCINDLKNELFQTCNSLIDKQKEVEDLKCKLSDSQDQVAESKSAGAQEGSQESIFQRSHFSSPDLGIESDPNHESSAPEQSDTNRSHDGIWSRVKPAQPVFIDRSTSPQVSDRATADSLHALCALQHYELLKMEVQESLSEIKSVLSRASDGLQHVSKFTSPRKSLECSTFKAILDSGENIVVCLYKARELLEQFRIESCPSKEEFDKLVQKNQKMQEELNSYLESRHSQERYLDEAMERLKQAELLKDQLEKKTTKKLLKTKKLIRQAERKLLEQRNQEIPLPKYPADDEPTCQNMP